MTGVVAVIGEPERREWVAGALRGEGIEVVEAPDLPALDGVEVVVWMNRDGDPLPARALEVLAARRVLIVRSCEPSYGLEPGIDHLRAPDDGAPFVYAVAALRHPRAFDLLRAMGAVKARRA